MGEESKKSDLQELKSNEPSTSEERVDELNQSPYEFPSSREAENEVSSRAACPVELQSTSHGTDLFAVIAGMSERTPVSSATEKWSPKGYDFAKSSSPEKNGCATGSESSIPAKLNLPEKGKKKSTSTDEFRIVIVFQLLENIWQKLSKELCSQLESRHLCSDVQKSSSTLSHELSLSAATASKGECVIAVRELDVIVVKIERIIYRLIQEIGTNMPPVSLNAECGEGISTASVVKEALRVGTTERMKSILENIEGRIITDVKTILEDSSESRNTPNADSSGLPYEAYRDRVITIGQLRIILGNTWEKFSAEMKSVLEVSF